MKRRDFLKAGLAATAVGFSASLRAQVQAADNQPLPIAPGVPGKSGRPNVLLVILEDWGPYLGCYGTTEMLTPNIDQLAAEGMRFTNCFTSCPVCSPGRSSLMTGCSQYTVHSQQHRTTGPAKRPLPAGIKSIPELFLDAGYFTALACGYSNKIDLNFQFNASQIYQGKDWKERKAGQPFYAHLTHMHTHRPWLSDADHPIDPSKVTLPPWYPDTPLTRKDWCLGLESAQRSDRDMGEIITRLKAEGLYDDTVIVVTSDHGVALPRGKQFLYDEGLRIPLMIRWPGKVKAGTVSDELLSNLDIVPTILGMVGLPMPEKLQGRDFLNPAHSKRKYIFAGRDKMDDTHDAQRAVRSERFKYILNLMPERAYCQYNEYKEHGYPGLAQMNVLNLEGKLPSQQAAFMKPVKPAEELYDLHNDPHELKNLADDPAFAEVIKEMRSELMAWRKAVGDPGINEAFRKGGWSSKYPTRSLAEWQTILSGWEDHILRHGPAPRIENPSFG